MNSAEAARKLGVRRAQAVQTVLERTTMVTWVGKWRRVKTDGINVRVYMSNVKDGILVKKVLNLYGYVVSGVYWDGKSGYVKILRGG